MANPKTTQEQSNSISDEFIELGRNIQKALQAAWTSEESKQLQAEVEAGLIEASKAIEQAANDFSKSQAGQTLKVEAEDFQKRIQSGELEAKVRSELLAIIRMANEELKKAFPDQASAGGKSAQPPKSSGAPK